MITEALMQSLLKDTNTVPDYLYILLDIIIPQLEDENQINELKQLQTELKKLKK